MPFNFNVLGKQQSSDSAYSTKTTSGDSNVSQHSLDFDELVDREFRKSNNDILPQKNPMTALEECKTKPVAFAVRTNIEYVPTREDNCPMPDRVISFEIKEYLHVKDKFDTDWWIGRRIRIGAPLGFLPSPMKLERIKTSSRRGAANLASSKVTEGAVTNVENMDDSKSKNNTLNAKEKRKIFFKRTQTIYAPYDVVPNIRPLVLVGPSLKGYDVTDMMQKAVFDFLKKRYEGSITITRVCADISLAKRITGGGGTGSNAVPPSAQGKVAFSLMERAAGGGNNRNSGLREVYEEIERIFELARTLHLVVLDCDTINHPAQLQKTSLAPIMVYLKISSPKVLQKLIKSRGKSQARNINPQLVAAEKLAQCPQDAYDIILDQNQLEDACAYLAEYLDEYWEATHPKLDEILETITTPLPAPPPSSNPTSTHHQYVPPLAQMRMPQAPQKTNMVAHISTGIAANHHSNFTSQHTGAAKHHGLHNASTFLNTSNRTLPKSAEKNLINPSSQVATPYPLDPIDPKRVNIYTLPPESNQKFRLNQPNLPLNRVPRL